MKYAMIQRATLLAMHPAILRQFRILFEEKKFVGYRIVHARTKNEALESFTRSFPRYSILQIREIIE